MYISPFWLGVVCTLSALWLPLIALVIIEAARTAKRGNNANGGKQNAK